MRVRGLKNVVNLFKLIYKIDRIRRMLWHLCYQVRLPVLLRKFQLSKSGCLGLMNLPVRTSER